MVAGCPAANRVGRCAVTYTSGSSTAAAVYGDYEPGFTADRAVQACAAIQGAFTGG